MAGGVVKALQMYLDALAAESMAQLVNAWNSMSVVERGLVSLCYGGIGPNQFGFRAEVGRG